MEELIDVLDQNGIKTGKVLTRSEIHKQGLWHRIIVVAIIDNQGQLLMQQRSDNKDTNSGKWDISTAGHVSAGQTSEEAAIREIFEEVGMEIAEEQLKYICTYKNISNVKDDYIDKQIYDFYIVSIDQINLKDIKMQESEVQQIKLCNKEEVQDMLDDKIVVRRPEAYKELIKYLK